MLPSTQIFSIVERITQLEKRIAQLEADKLTTLSGWSTWTPTSPGASWTNVTSLVAQSANYLRYSNFVFCIGRVDLALNAGGGTQTIFHLTLPVSAVLTNAYDLVGSFFRFPGDESGLVRGVIDPDNRASFIYNATNTSPALLYFFMYKISS